MIDISNGLFLLVQNFFFTNGRRILLFYINMVQKKEVKMDKKKVQKNISLKFSPKSENLWLLNGVA